MIRRLELALHECVWSRPETVLHRHLQLFASHLLAVCWRVSDAVRGDEGVQR